jgi:formate--tetrahydrofolate ligase
MKGGAAGGGYAQVVPMEDINLHFTGDFHAVTTAHNLLSAMVDNHIQHGNELGIDPRSITWKRVMDMNERALRDIVIGLGGKANGIPRESGFDITTASEIMAILALSNDLMDLRDRMSRVIVGFNKDGKPVTAEDLHAHGAMTVVMKDAIKPNLVQTLEGTPALIHAGPFGNIAHGCNSIIATKMGIRLADYVITEAGFGSDLGAEKFMNIVCRTAGIAPDAAVVVATVRALKMHGGVSKADLDTPNIEAIERGLPNLIAHCKNVSSYGIPIVVSINRFGKDTDEEISYLQSRCSDLGIEAAVSEVFDKGSEGGIALGEKVLEALEKPSSFRFLYESDLSIKEKIGKIAVETYGADKVDYTAEANKKIAQISDLGFGELPICMAKTQYSFSDDATLLGCPKGFDIIVRDVKVSAGAGFIVAYTGTVMTMPGLPTHPSAEKIDIDSNGKITGLS